MIQEQKIYMHDVSSNYMRRSLNRSYAFLMLNPCFFIEDPHQTPIMLSSMHSPAAFVHNKLMPYTAKVRGDLMIKRDLLFEPPDSQYVEW